MILFFLITQHKCNSKKKSKCKKCKYVLISFEIQTLLFANQVLLKINNSMESKNGTFLWGSFFSQINYILLLQKNYIHQKYLKAIILVKSLQRTKLVTWSISSKLPPKNLMMANHSESSILNLAVIGWPASNLKLYRSRDKLGTM